MIVGIIIGLSFILDGILTNYLSFMKNDLSLFTPLFTVVSIFIVYPFYYKQMKKYIIHMFILGILYDLFYTNLLFWNGLLFVGIAFLSSYLYKNFEMNWFKILFQTMLVIAVYELLNAFIIFCFQLVPITLYDVSYKVLHSLLLNVIYVEGIYLLLKLVPKKYKKISIN